METLFFLLFCLAAGYVCLWVLVNERRGSADGEWGIIAMRTVEPDEPARADRPGASARGPSGWKP